MKNLSKKSTFPFFESIRFQDGHFMHLEWHEDRLNRTLREVYNRTFDLKLLSFLEPTISTKVRKDITYKVRLDYSDVDYHVSWEPYYRQPVQILLLTETDRPYPYKFTYRSWLDEPTGYQFACRLFHDGIFVLDTSYGNLVCHDGERWVTPAHYLLPGTTRARLIQEGLLAVNPIRLHDLKNYKRISFINAMNDLEERPDVNVVLDIAWSGQL